MSKSITLDKHEMVIDMFEYEAIVYELKLKTKKLNKSAFLNQRLIPQIDSAIIVVEGKMALSQP